MWRASPESGHTRWKLPCVTVERGWRGKRPAAGVLDGAEGVASCLPWPGLRSAQSWVVCRSSEDCAGLENCRMWAGQVTDSAAIAALACLHLATGGVLIPALRLTARR